MSWNYRIIKHDTEDFRVHEVYYDKAGNIEGWTKEGILMEGDAPEDIWQQLEYVLQDTKSKPVLDLKELEEMFKEEKEK